MSGVTNISNHGNSLQVSHMGNIPSIPFSLGGSPFLVKNISGDEVTLTIITQGGEKVSTVLSEGWNPELITEITSGSASGLQYGY